MLDLLNQDISEETAKYIKTILESWKEKEFDQMTQESEQALSEKMEELERENASYREELKEQFTEKMLEGLAELKETVRAEVLSEVIKNNPELKILTQIKSLVAPLIDEDYRDNMYEDTLIKLSEENEKLKRECELNEGKETLTHLLQGYNAKTQQAMIQLIEPGSPEEIQEQFYKLYNNLSVLFESDNSDDSDDSYDSSDSSDDSDDSYDFSDDSDDSYDFSDDSDDSSSGLSEGYISEGYKGFPDDGKKSKKESKKEPQQKISSLADIIKLYV